MKEIVLLKIGGSILSPSPELLFDYSAAIKIRDALLPLTEKYNFILSIGGGNLARLYQGIIKDHGGNDRDIDWIGTSACNHNAVALRSVLGELAMDRPITGDSVKSIEPIIMDKPFLLVGAADPGHSSDFDAVTIAKRTGSKKIISLKNVDGVYDDDPHKNPNAKKFNRLTWDEYRKDILKTDTFTPKMAVPVDPIASIEAQKNNITFIILNGSDLENLLKAIGQEEFIGTTIKD